MHAISVTYRNLDGVHVFTSPDVKGLYVASADPKEAFECVSEGIETLLRLNDGKDMAVEPAITLAEFLGHLGLDKQDTGTPHPAVIELQRVLFNTREAA